MMRKKNKNYRLIKDKSVVCNNRTRYIEEFSSSWKSGDWEKFSQLASDSLEQHQERVDIFILSSLGLIQVGQLDLALAYLQKAKKWGGRNHLIVQASLSALHKTLSNAIDLIHQPLRSKYHSEKSSLIAELVVFTILIAKVKYKIKRGTHNIFAYKYWKKNAYYPSSNKSKIMEKLDFKLKGEVDLGESWAGNTINTVIFRHHGLMTIGEYQYTGFYVNRNTMRIVRRFLKDDTLEVSDITGEYNLNDAHNSISLGMDRDGYIHISYDHHASQLKYRRSEKPYSISAWTNELPMTGENEERVTYPTFILPRLGFPLTLLYRNGSHECGTAYIKTYDENKRSWIDHPKAILSGAEQRPWSANGYWNNPVAGKDGSLHLSFVWRTHSIGDDNIVNNINICYAKSFDNGLSWSSSNSQPYLLPITPTNAETIWPISPGSNLINQCSMALDSHQFPHIVFYSNHPDNRIPTIQHLWFNGAKWKQQFVYQSLKRFNLQGKGTLKIPISRPNIIIDRKDNIHIIFRDSERSSAFIIKTLRPPNYLSSQGTICVLEDSIGFSEPVIDIERWKKESVLSILQQYCDQPDNDSTANEIYTHLKIADMEAD